MMVWIFTCLRHFESCCLDRIMSCASHNLNSPPQVTAAARFGKGRTVSDLGWKDTVLVWPGETVRIAIDFSHDFPGSQTYLLHCHNLEHEDAGMMINFRVQA